MDEPMLQLKGMIYDMTHEQQFVVQDAISRIKAIMAEAEEKVPGCGVMAVAYIGLELQQ